MIKIIKREDFRTSTWSGGTTTELYIYPETAQYKALDFDFRISSATVDLEESTFTPLSGINRLIMSLNHPLYLSHKGQYDIKLKAFDVDAFKGDWQTTSKGKVTDFNVMFNDQYQANLKLDHRKQINNDGFLVIYAHDQVITISNNNNQYVLNIGDLFISDENLDWLIKGDSYICTELKPCP